MTARYAAERAFRKHFNDGRHRLVFDVVDDGRRPKRWWYRREGD